MPIVLPEQQTVLHSWCRQIEWNAPTVVGGEGAWFVTEDGRRILDMSSLSECSNLGHQHPHVIAAIKAQAEKLCFVTSAWGAESRARLAEALLERSEFEGGRVYFTLGGADANEHAVKFARQARGQPGAWVITRDRSYHGASYAAMALSGDSRTREQVNPAHYRVAHARSPYVYRCPFGTGDASQCARQAALDVKRLMQRHFADGVAAVLMEPNAGTNGIVAPDEYWPALRVLTEEEGVFLIADEVMSGFGRCGEWFAWQRHGEAGRPDMMTLAKGLTGAHLPLGAVVLSAKIANALESKFLYTGLTYCGHPLSCAAGVAALEAYADENLIERSRSMGGKLLEDLQEIQRRHPVIGDVRGGHGLFAVLELVQDRNSREPLAPWPETHAALKTLIGEALEADVSFATRGNLIILAPPLVISDQELAQALELLDALLGKLERALNA